MSSMALLISLLILVTAFVALVLLRPRGAFRGTAEATGREGSETIEQSPIGVALTWALGIGGGLTLARALLELLSGLAELPGASEHWAGDVMLWLILVLPIPIMAGSAGLLAARWLSGHAIGARRASAAWLVLAGIAMTWILLDVAFVVGQGNYLWPLDDPLLWAPIAGVIGTISGVVLLVAILVRRRIPQPTHPRHR